MDVRAIAAELGLARATLYRWFGSRDGLLGEMIARDAEQYFRRVRARVKGRGGRALLETFDRINRGLTRSSALRRFLEQERESALRTLTSSGGIVEPRSVAVDRGADRGRGAPGCLRSAGRRPDAGVRDRRARQRLPLQRRRGGDPRRRGPPARRRGGAAGMLSTMSGRSANFLYTDLDFLLTCSMQADRFTVKSQEALAAAQRLAGARHNPEVAPSHLLLALLEQEGGIVVPVLRRAGADPERSAGAAPTKPPTRSPTVTGEASATPALGIGPDRPAQARRRRGARHGRRVRLDRAPAARPRGGSAASTPAPRATSSSRPSRRSAGRTASPTRTPRTSTRRSRPTAAISPRPPSRASSTR